MFFWSKTFNMRVIYLDDNIHDRSKILRRGLQKTGVEVITIKPNYKSINFDILTKGSFDAIILSSA